MKLRYVQAFVDRKTGLAFHYFRRHGCRIRLPGLPGSREFMTAYQEALDQPFAAQMQIGSGRNKPGSVAATVAAYFLSPQFAEFAPSTQAALRSTLQRFRDQHGELPLGSMPPKFIQLMLSKLTPGVARNWYKHIRALCQFAVSVEMIERDPTQGIKRPKAKTQRRRPWTDAEVAQFERTHPIGSKARLAMALGLHTLQRLGDVIHMGRQHIHNGWLAVKQQKTGTELSLPIHKVPELLTIIDATPSGHLTFLVKDSGKPYGPTEFSGQFRKWSDEAGLPKGCTFHGLRATGCTRKADNGCSTHEIAAWSGHMSLKEVERYTKSSDQKKLAISALERRAANV
jgi:integrase